MENSSFGRLISVLTNPSKTFESIRERPTWLVPLLVLVLVLAGLGIMLHIRTDYHSAEYEETIQRTMERFGQELNEEQIEEALTRGEKTGIISAIAPSVVSPIFLLFITLLYWVGVKLGGSEARYKQLFSTILYAGVPGILKMLLSMIIILPKSVLPFKQLATRNFLPASNLGILMPDGSSAALTAIMTGIDAFSIWSSILLIIGLKTVTKVSTATATVLVVILYAIGLALVAGLAMLSS